MVKVMMYGCNGLYGSMLSGNLIKDMENVTVAAGIDHVQVTRRIFLYLHP